MLFFYSPFSFQSAVSSADLDAKLAEIDAYARKAHVDWDVPGMAVAIVKDDKIVFAKGYGIQKLGGNDKVNADTLLCYCFEFEVVYDGFTCDIDRRRQDWRLGRQSV